MPQAFYRVFPAGSRRSAMVKHVHIVRAGPMRAPYRRPKAPVAPQAYCYLVASDGTGGKSSVVILDELPAEPPNGLTWCSTCVGRWADEIGQTNAVVAMLRTALQTPEAPPGAPGARPNG